MHQQADREPTCCGGSPAAGGTPPAARVLVVLKSLCVLLARWVLVAVVAMEAVEPSRWDCSMRLLVVVVVKRTLLVADSRGTGSGGRTTAASLSFRSKSLPPARPRPINNQCARLRC